MRVGDEDQRGRGKNDQGGERRQHLVGLDLDAERIGEAEHRRRADRHRLQREEHQAAEDADRRPDCGLDDDQAQRRQRVGAERAQRRLIDENRRQRQRRRHGDKQPDLHRNLRIRPARHQHQAAADAAEQHEHRQSEVGIEQPDDVAVRIH